MSKQYYWNTITLVVLSDRSIQNDCIANIVYECDQGDCVLQSVNRKSKTITRKVMDRELKAAGSDEFFFQMEDNH